MDTTCGSGIPVLGIYPIQLHPQEDADMSVCVFIKALLDSRANGKLNKCPQI